MKQTGFFINREPWTTLANCKGADPDLFILKKGQSSSPAKAICKKCKVKDPCLEYGIKTKSVGIWGGIVLSEHSEEIELYPVRSLQDATVIKLIQPNQKLPAILGRQAASFKKFPSIMGVKDIYYQTDLRAADGT